jgi:hypothetical protein
MKNYGNKFFRITVIYIFNIKLFSLFRQIKISLKVLGIILNFIKL